METRPHLVFGKSLASRVDQFCTLRISSIGAKTISPMMNASLGFLHSGEWVISLGVAICKYVFPLRYPLRI